LAVDYMLTKPKGVNSLVLAGPVLSSAKYMEDGKRLKANLPAETREIIDRNENAGMTSKEYRAAIREYYRQHMCRLDPFPPELMESMRTLGWDVMNTMWGPGEFRITGTLKDFDRSGRLREITVPTLFTAGRYDVATPETTAWYHSLMPGSSIKIFEGSSHLPWFELENPARYLDVVRAFLKDVEGNPREKRKEPAGPSAR